MARPPGMVHGDPPPPPEAPKKTRDVKAFIQQALDRFKVASDAEDKSRKEQQSDREFFDDDQWDDAIQMSRHADSRPCLVINRLKQPINMTNNQQRASRPAIQVNPIDSGADKDTAEVFQGIIRNIETNSHADVVYQTAAKNQVVSGLGYLRVLTDYVDDASFDQDILLKRIPDPATVYFDPAAQEMDFSDGRYAFIIEDVPKEEYTQRFPDSHLSGLDDFRGVGDGVPEWFPEGGVRIAEYFYLEPTIETIAQVQITTPGNPQTGQPPSIDTQVIPKKDLPDPLPPEMKILNTRESTKSVVKWCKINATEILDEQDWPGKWIPIVPMLGEEFWLKGRRRLRGMVRGAKGAQQTYNYQVSAQVEAIALAPKSPFIMAEGQDEDYETQWAQANVRNFAVLKYKPVSVGGQIAAPPQRSSVEPAIQAITMAIHQAEADIRSTTAFFDASDASRANVEQSGKAILARQKQGEVTNSNYMDNMGIAVRHTGRILIDLIPKIYDAPRVMRITGLDAQPRDIIVHAGKPPVPPPSAAAPPPTAAAPPTPGPPPMAAPGGPPPPGPPGGMPEPMAAQPPPGMPPPDPMAPPPPPPPATPEEKVHKIYDLSIGRYDVAITVGPSHESKRQEAVEAMIQFVQAYPQVFPIIGDLLVSNMDWPGAQEISERLKLMVPPAAQSNKDGPAPIPPAIQAQMQQLQQRLQQQDQLLKQQHDQLDGHQIKAQTTIQTVHLETDRAIALQQMKDATAIAVAQIYAETKGLQMRTEAANEAMALHQEQVHAAATDAADAQQQAVAQMARQQHEAQMSAQGHAQDLVAGHVEHGQSLVQGEAEHRRTLEQLAQEAALNPDDHPPNNPSLRDAMRSDGADRSDGGV